MTHGHFEMDTLNIALGMVKKNIRQGYIASIDLTDANYFVPVATADQTYLMLQFERIRYKYVCFRNGLLAAPRIFKPVLSSLMKRKRHVMNYLDDFSLVGDTFVEFKDAVIDT